MAGKRIRLLHALIAAVIIAGVVAAVAALVLSDITGEGGSGLGEAFEYDLGDLRRVGDELVGFRETGRFETGLREAKGVAVGPEDRIYVAGDKAVKVFDSAGKPLFELTLEGEPRCLAVVSDGAVLVGMKDHVMVDRLGGASAAAWECLGPSSVITSIAVMGGEVFAADAGKRVVLRYDRSGRLLGRIGERDEDRNVPGFVVPSPCFDIAAAPDGLLRAVNPGRHRIEAYTAEGDLEFWWGKAGTDHEGFSGCCNPAHFAVTPDGGFVTSEKGMLHRVKLYDADGGFVCYVAPPEALGEGTAGFDIAVDSKGRVLILDTTTQEVRVFVRDEAHDG